MKNPILKADQHISGDANGIRFEDRFPGWLRLVLLPWTPLCLPLIALYWQNARATDWANPPIMGILVSTTVFVILPLGFSALLLGVALLGRSTELSLDARAGEAVLVRKSLLQKRVMHFPLAQVEIVKIELQAYHPANETALVVLRMPNGAKVGMTCFFRDEDAQFWAAKIDRIIKAAQSSNVARTGQASA